MESLQRYTECFEATYPDYGDTRYAEIRQLVEVYLDPKITALIASEPFGRAVALVRPLVAIKNYKSRVPFPEDIRAAVVCIRKIACMAPRGGEKLNGHAGLLTRLLEIQGFRLPTASAVFHFCHPEYFPIVDVNVEAACVCLSERYPQDFSDIEVPSLPRSREAGEIAVGAYQGFIRFIKRVCDLQAGYTSGADFRYVDKALMVLGGIERARA